MPPGEAARVWLYATARKVIPNQRRSRRRRLALQQRLELDAVSARPHSPALDHDEIRVHQALQRLEARDREVLLLAEWEGLSAAQIAAVVGCLTVTARGRLHRARQRFRAAFEATAATDGDEPQREPAELSTSSLYSVRFREGGS